MDIKLHIVAPSAKLDKVFQEIRRPVFSLLEKGPLAESCTDLSYDSLRELAGQKHLAHLSDTCSMSMQSRPSEGKQVIKSGVESHSVTDIP